MFTDVSFPGKMKADKFQNGHKLKTKSGVTLISVNIATPTSTSKCFKLQKKEIDSVPHSALLRLKCLFRCDSAKYYVRSVLLAPTPLWGGD